MERMTSNGKADLKKIVEQSEPGEYVPTENLLKDPCPRCLGPIPSLEYAGMFPGAMSRTDNKTEICSNCGTQEAIEQMAPREAQRGRSDIMPQSEWQINRVR